jgi:mRNA-degrading endonuclease RelE of RelBE toxin-antitoxin system
MQNELPDNQSKILRDTEAQLSVQIDLTPEFRRNLRDLAKRYRNIRADVQTVIENLQAGEFIGDRLAGIGKGYAVFKVRVKNRDIQKGKSAGYRLVYQVESDVSVLLLTIYSKSDQEDIDAKEVLGILDEFYGTD